MVDVLRTQREAQRPPESAVNVERHGARHLESDTGMRYRET